MPYRLARMPAWPVSNSSKGGRILLTLFKKRQRTDGLIGVYCPTNGIAVARIHWDKSRHPVLESCSFRAITSHNELRRNLRVLCDSLHLDDGIVSTAVEPGEYQLLLIEAPDVQPTELKAAIRWRIKDLLDFHIDDAVIDVFEIPGQNRTGQARMMYAIAARETVVRQHVDDLVTADMQLEIIDIPEMCLRNIAALTDEDTQGAATLYLAPHSGLIVLTHDGTLYLTRKLELGTEMLTGLNAQAAMDTVVLEIQRSLDYYDSHFSQPAIAGVLLAPTETPVPGLLEYLTANLGINVKPLDINNLVDCSQPVADADQARCLMAIGAALRKESVAL